MKNLRMAMAVAFAVGIPKFCLMAGANHSTAAMLTLLLMLGVATLGDWLLALVTAAAGCLAFNLYFVDGADSMRITTLEGAVTFATMALTALTGTLLALRAQRRAEEADGRRRLFECMTKLGQRLVAGQTFQEVAHAGMAGIIELFGVAGVRLRTSDEPAGMAAGKPEGSCYQVPLRTPRGATLELFGSAPAPDACAALGGMISVHLERSLALEERARAEGEKRGEVLRSTVLNALAHDFRTPLTSIKVAASLLRAGSRGTEHVSPETERELVEVIDEEADRLERLLRESLELARMDGKRRTAAEEECGIPDIVERVRGRMARYVGRREFAVRLEPNLPRVRGDAFLIEQMLTQVADNAWKYSQPGSRIEISASASDADTLRLTVRNEGSEIPESERELIFDKFYRGSNERSKSEGTGLGLAIAKTIVETYGGSLRLDIGPLGPAFHFELPIARNAGWKQRVPAGRAAAG